MPETTYTYSLSADFPGGSINQSRLDVELKASAIVTALDRVDRSGNVINIVFKAALSTNDKTLLDNNTTGPAGGLIAAHDNAPDLPSVALVNIDQPASIDGILFTTPKASGVGYILNDRDFIIRTSETNGSTAIEDLLVDPSDQSQIPWGEASLYKVYKPVDINDPNGPHVQVTDQTDADANATCSVFNYQCMSGGSPITYEIAGGSLYIDLHKVGLGATTLEREWHRIYVLAAAGIPAAYGGQIRLFDGYLAPWEQQWLVAASADAFRVTYVPQAPPASVISVWIYYPPGAKVTHVLRLKLYRHTGQ